MIEFRIPEESVRALEWKTTDLDPTWLVARIDEYICAYRRSESDRSQHNNGGDYDRWLAVLRLPDAPAGELHLFVGFRSSADFPGYCPECGQFESEGHWQRMGPDRPYECPAPDVERAQRLLAGVTETDWLIGNPTNLAWDVAGELSGVSRDDRRDD